MVAAAVVTGVPAKAVAIVDRDCALVKSDCTLAATARQAHVFAGTAISRSHGPAELAVIAEHFNAVTTENEMKWGDIAPTVGNYDFGDADALADFAAANGLRLRGHTLVWGRMQLPSDLASTVAAAADPEARLQRLLRQHFRTMTERYGDRVDLWDVVNEPFDILAGIFDPNLFHTTLGPGYVARAFRRAHDLDPDAELFLNEFSLGYPSAKLEALVELVTELRAQGVPVHGVGIQAHFFPLLPLPSREAFEAALRALGDLGVAVELTELDVSIWHFRNDADPLARQAEFYGEVASACMAVPACRGITVWGLADPETWLDGTPPFDSVAPNAPLLFDGSLQPKPAYFAVRDAVRMRAVPFADQASEIRSRLVAAIASGEAVGDSALTARRRLAGARRALAAQGFADGCAKLASASTLLGQAEGVAIAGLVGDVAMLRGDLRCDEE